MVGQRQHHVGFGSSGKRIGRIGGFCNHADESTVGDHLFFGFDKVRIGFDKPVGAGDQHKDHQDHSNKGYLKSHGAYSRSAFSGLHNKPA